MVVAASPAPSTDSCFPNPVTDQATLTSLAATTLTVRDAPDRAVQVLPLVAGTQQVSLSALPSGVYALANQAAHHTMRLVKAAH